MVATWYALGSFMVAAQTLDFIGFVTKATKTTIFFNNPYYILLYISYIPFFFLLYLFDSLVVLVVLVVYRVA